MEEILMMKLKHNFKKGLALVLALAMVAGSDLVMPGGANKVQAATGTGTAPSVTAFATKDQLMTAFNPDSNGNATTIGRLVFGKNISDEAQEWYILGKDKGVLGDNTIIFAASPIVYSTKFESSGSNKNDVSLWSDCNYGGVSVTEVFANHYGASNLRGELKTMAKNTSYFTAAEQDLMNNTSVTTKDTKNRNNYTTTDKLYALAADGYRSSTIKAGSDNSTVLAMSNYWNSGTTFWLRSPRDDFADAALLASSGSWVNYNEVYYYGAVQPASNLDLSSVLFASAATAASSDTAVAKTIALEAAMNLRLNGTGKDIGTVTYSTTTGDIKVVRGDTSQPVSLVVQGNDGTNDWYYSKQIAGPETVNASDIKSALSLTSDIDLSACKIWLEITEDNVSYAVNAEKEIEKINTTYVTKDELMTAFEPNANGTETNYGKLVFGKKSDGTTAQEWYILGKDEGVSGDNTIIFAASPIATNQVFEDDYFNNKAFQINFGVYESAPTEVYPNHYGASDLRAKLKTMATNTSYFTTAEQSLMNATTVTTEDKKNSTAYTTTDKLYALAADGLGDSYTTIKAGSDNKYNTCHE